MVARAGEPRRPAARGALDCGVMRDRVADKYASCAELARHERLGRDFRIRSVHRPHSPALIIAPHGGNIEAGTSELAAHIAGERHSFFAFEGMKARPRTRDLHVTSHRFDHPECLSLLAGASVVLGVHGCRGREGVYLGGLDTVLRDHLGTALLAAGVPALIEGHPYPGRHPANICNRGRHGRGVQLELTHDWRIPPRSFYVAVLVREALEAWIDAERPQAAVPVPAPPRHSDLS